MSSSFKEKVDCPTCGHEQEGIFYNSINVSTNPELKAPFKNKKINWVVCSMCGTDIFAPFKFVYHDMDKGFLVIFKHPNSINDATEKTFDQFNERLKLRTYLSYPLIVNDPYELILAVDFLEKSRVPKTDEEVKEMKLLVKNAISTLNLPKMANSPNINHVQQQSEKEPNKSASQKLNTNEGKQNNDRGKGGAQQFIVQYFPDIFIQLGIAILVYNGHFRQASIFHGAGILGVLFVTIGINLVVRRYFTKMT